MAAKIIKVKKVSKTEMTGNGSGIVSYSPYAVIRLHFRSIVSET